jgi:hypothetical protein
MRKLTVGVCIDREGRHLFLCALENQNRKKRKRSGFPLNFARDSVCLTAEQARLQTSGNRSACIKDKGTMHICGLSAGMLALFPLAGQSSRVVFPV